MREDQLDHINGSFFGPNKPKGVGRKAAGRGKETVFFAAVRLSPFAFLSF
jgi:hypothetical protein